MGRREGGGGGGGTSFRQSDLSITSRYSTKEGAIIMLLVDGGIVPSFVVCHSRLFTFIQGLGVWGEIIKETHGSFRVILILCLYSSQLNYKAHLTIYT